MKANTLLIILSTFCISACNTNSDQETVLVIGKYKLTKADLEYKIKKDRYKSLTDEALQDKLIDEGRLIASAIDQRYDTLATLKRLFEYASRSYAAQVDGFIWNKKVKSKLALKEEDIRNIYRKRTQQYILEVVLISDKSVLDSYYRSSEDVNTIKAKAASDPNVRVFNAAVKFPFYPLSYYTRDLNSLKVGQIIGPVESERGYMLARVLAAKPLVQNSYEQEKANIRQELHFGLIQKYLWENQKRILKEANPEMYDTAIEELALKFDKQKKNWPGVKPHRLIMKYNFDGKQISYQVSDFHEFVTNEPAFAGSLTAPDGVKKILRTIIIEQYLFAEAHKMNMEADKEYQRFRKDNQYDMLLEHYKRTNIYPKLSISPKESEDYYRKNTGNFKSFQFAKISLFKFKSIQNAIQGRILVEKKIRGIAPSVGDSNNANSQTLPAAIEMQVKIDGPNNNAKLLETILRLSPGQTSSPLEINGEFVIIVVTAKQGSITIPYMYVKDDIQRLIYSQKENQLTARIEEGLKEKYPVEKDEIKKYLSETK